MLVLALAFVAPAVSLVHASPPGQSASIEVKMVEFAFQPQTVTITPGQAVSWSNSGAVAHTTTSDLPSTDSTNYWDSTLPSGMTFERVFLNPGTYTYYCKFHRGQGMTGTVIVLGAGSVTPTATGTATATAVPGAPTATPAPPTATPAPGTPTATVVNAQPSFFITSPTEGQVISTTELIVRLEVNNVTLRPTGAPNRAGEGHFSLFLDNLPEIQVADKQYTFPNVAAGNHALRVELRQNDNTPFTPPLQATVNFRSTAGQAPATATVPPPPPSATRPPATPTTPPQPGAPTPTIGLPKTGDGSYRPGGPGQSASYLLAAAAGLGFAALLLRRSHRSRG